jgi:hypothetical protein
VDYHHVDVSGLNPARQMLHRVGFRLMPCGAAGNHPRNLDAGAPQNIGDHLGLGRRGNYIGLVHAGVVAKRAHRALHHGAARDFEEDLVDRPAGAHARSSAKHNYDGHTHLQSPISGVSPAEMAREANISRLRAISAGLSCTR